MSNLSIVVDQVATPEAIAATVREFDHIAQREHTREEDRLDAQHKRDLELKAAARRESDHVIGFWGWLAVVAVTGAIVRVAAAKYGADVARATALSATSALPVAPAASAASALPTHV